MNKEDCINKLYELAYTICELAEQYPNDTELHRLCEIIWNAMEEYENEEKEQ